MARTSASSTPPATSAPTSVPGPTHESPRARPGALNSTTSTAHTAVWLLLFTWQNRPELGDTEIAVPDGLFRAGTRIESTPGDVVVRHDPGRRVLVCLAPVRGPITVRVSEPGIATRAEDRGMAAVAPGRWIQKPK